MARTKSVDINFKENSKKYWKTQEGALVEISKLTNDELIYARNKALKSNQKFFDLYTMFTDLLDAMDKELEERHNKTKNLLKKIETELDK